MMKGFKIDLKGRKQRLKYQERQRLKQAEVRQERGTEQTKGKLDKFASRLI